MACNTTFILHAECAQVTSGGNFSTFSVLFLRTIHQGQVQQHGRLLVALLLQCCECNQPASDFAQAAVALHECGIDITEQQWWPASFSDSIRAALPAVAAQSSQPVSPLVFACACRNSAASWRPCQIRNSGRAISTPQTRLASHLWLLQPPAGLPSAVSCWQSMVRS